MRKPVFIAQAAIIAGMYAALTYILAPLSYGQIQIRISEALTVLPAFTPAAIPGLFIGCLAANLLGPNGIIDVLAGSVATLIAAVLSRYMPKKWMVPLPPVVVNALAIGALLNYLYQAPLLLTMLYVFAGQALACYGLGYPLMLLLESNKERIFKQQP